MPTGLPTKGLRSKNDAMRTNAGSKKVHTSTRSIITSASVFYTCARAGIEHFTYSLSFVINI